MTQTHTDASPLPPATSWRQALQLKLMAALDAAWAMIEDNTDPALIRAARERAKAIGDIAAMARKVVLLEPPPKPGPGPDVTAQAERLARVMAPGLAAEALTSTLKTVPAAAATTAPVAAPMAAQAEHARRALEKLKGGRRGRL
ncbi:MAG: hypothetical protein J7515_06580 [Caulobacter sp.]|nr:hypothetical protein [Caulobacter sp.]